MRGSVFENSSKRIFVKILNVEARNERKGLDKAVECRESTLSLKLTFQHNPFYSVIPINV